MVAGPDDPSLRGESDEADEEQGARDPVRGARELAVLLIELLAFSNEPKPPREPAHVVEGSQPAASSVSLEVVRLWAKWFISSCQLQLKSVRYISPLVYPQGKQLSE
jgi:hypothetical protein